MNLLIRQRAILSACGHDLSPQTIENVLRLYHDEQKAVAHNISATAVNLPYGPDPRHRLDVYVPPAQMAPVLIWVPGGGFMRGDKGSTNPEHWQDANVGRAGVQMGFLTLSINYRLAPGHPWPAGAEDVGAAVAWALQHAADYGGDPTCIFLAGASAGASHVAGYLKLHPQHERQIRGAVLLSPVFGFTPIDDPRLISYYGTDAAQYADRIPLEAVVDTQLPLLVVSAEFDPPRFQEEFLGLLRRRLARHGTMPRAYVASGHNHFSLAYHLGSSDMRLSAEIHSFVRQHSANFGANTADVLS